MIQWRRLALIVAVTFASLVGVGVSLPPLAATALGARTLERWFDRHYGEQLQIRIDSLELHWGGPQVLHGVHLMTREGEPILVVEEASTNTSLTTILWHKFWNGQIYLDEPIIAKLDFGRDEELNLSGPIQSIAASAEGDGAQLVLDAPIVIPGRDAGGVRNMQLSGRLEIAPMQVELEPSIAQKMRLNPQVALQTTPFHFEMRDGRLELARADWLLADKYHFVFWGAIGLLEQQMHMTLGVGSAAAASLFNLKSIPEGEFLQVPIVAQPGELFIDKQGAKSHAIVYIMRSKGLHFLQNVLRMKEPPPLPSQTGPLPWQTGSADQVLDPIN
jgi:hypothetical protein